MKRRPVEAERHERRSGRAWRPWVAALVLVAAPLALRAQGTLPRVLAPATVIDGNDEQPMRWPVALAVASGDELAVADAWRPRLLLFRRVGVTWGLDRAVELAAPPAAVAFDGDRWVVALRGKGLVAVARDGSSAAPRPAPAGLVARSLTSLGGGVLAAYDSARGRVVRFDAAGAELGATAVREAVLGLAPDGAGGFWMAVGEAGEVRRVSAAGEVVETWKVPPDAPEPAWPVGVAVEPGGRLFVLDRFGGRVVALDAAGRGVGVGAREGWDVGLLRFPSALARLPDGSLVVADQGNGRVQSFRLLGGAGQ